MADRVLHNGLQNHFGDQDRHDRLVLFNAIIEPVEEPVFLDDQIALHLLKLLLHRHKVCAVFHAVPKHGGQGDQDPAGFPVFLFDQIPVDAIQGIVQKMRADLALQHLDLCLPLADFQFQRMLVAEGGGACGHIAGRVNIRHLGLHEFVDRNAALHRYAAAFQESHVGANTSTDDHKVSGNGLFVLQMDQEGTVFQLFDPLGDRSGVQSHTLFVNLFHQHICALLIQNAGHDAVHQLDDRHLHASVAGCPRGLQRHKAGTDHNGALAILEFRHPLVHIRLGPHVAHAFLMRALDGRSQCVRAGGDQQLIVVKAAAVFQEYLVRLCIQFGHGAFHALCMQAFKIILCADGHALVRKLAPQHIGKQHAGVRQKALLGDHDNLAVLIYFTEVLQCRQAGGAVADNYYIHAITPHFFDVFC